MDPSSIPTDGDDILSPQYDSPHEFITSRIYVHHSGCALVQPVCEQRNNANPESRSWRPVSRGSIGSRSSTSSRSSQLLDTSTPLMSPKDASRTFSPSAAELKCGFYWYKNFMIAKQKNLSSSLVKHDSLFTEFAALCSNSSGQLSDLCTQLFGWNPDIVHVIVNRCFISSVIIFNAITEIYIDTKSLDIIII